MESPENGFFFVESPHPGIEEGDKLNLEEFYCPSNFVGTT